MSTPAIPKLEAATVESLQLALSYVNDEMGKLYALAFALECALEPKNPEDPQDDENINAWRLATVMTDRLGSTKFRDNMRMMLLSQDARDSA